MSRMPRALPGRPRVFRDPIHGDILYAKGGLQELVEAILDTRMFQRLRHIRQNGVLNLVFHGAEHSRLSHSMGAAWTAARMFDLAYRNTADESICIEKEREREETILAALLHDVGHGPFSHTLEEILESLGVEFDHEEMTRRVLTEDGSEIAALLEAHSPGLGQRLVPFIVKKHRDPNRWFYAIVSSSLDADRLDYLLRDSTMAGVWTHRFDASRLIEALGVKHGEIVVDARARDVVESYLLAMEQMYASVYYHHTNRAASFLLGATIQCAADLAHADKKLKAVLFPRRPRGPDPLWSTIQDGHTVPLSIYATLDENHVWSLISLWSEVAHPMLSELATALKRRRLPKVIPIGKHNMPPKGLKSLEERARELCKRVDPSRDPKYYVRADKPKRKAYTPGLLIEGFAGSIKLLYEDGRLVPVEDVERSIAFVIKDQVMYPSLIVPEELRVEAEKLLEEPR